MLSGRSMLTVEELEALAKTLGYEYATFSDGGKWYAYINGMPLRLESRPTKQEAMNAYWEKYINNRSWEKHMPKYNQ